MRTTSDLCHCCKAIFTFTDAGVCYRCTRLRKEGRNPREDGQPSAVASAQAIAPRLTLCCQSQYDPEEP